MARSGRSRKRIEKVQHRTVRAQADVARSRQRRPASRPPAPRGSPQASSRRRRRKDCQFWDVDRSPAGRPARSGEDRTRRCPGRGSPILDHCAGTVGDRSNPLPVGAAAEAAELHRAGDPQPISERRASDMRLYQQQRVPRHSARADFEAVPLSSLHREPRPEQSGERPEPCARCEHDLIAPVTTRGGPQ